MSLNSIFQYFVPKDKKIFFPLFEQAAANVVDMAVVMVEAVNCPDANTRETLYQQIDKLENVGDDITHQIYLELGKNFITPFDREDIHSLATAIDDVADLIQGSANRMSLYQITEMTEPIQKLSELILQASYDLQKAIAELKDLKNVRSIAESCIRINSIENQADYVFDRAVADLFLYEKDAIRLIKYKEILAALETATDRCEDAAKRDGIDHCKKRLVMISTLLVVVVILALVFDFINGFHDAANSIATIVSTKVLTPFQAVLWAASFNFLAYFLIKDHKVANTVAKTVFEQFINMHVILAGLLAAITWNLITWWFGIPSSSSHTLIGGFAGAGMTNAAFMHINPFSAVNYDPIVKIVIFIFLAPIIGMLIGMAINILIMHICKNARPSVAEVWFKRLQLVSSGALSFAHGGNDAQKVMGIIYVALVASKVITNNQQMPEWIPFACYSAIAAGTMSGGWKIVKTMGTKITKVTPLEGVSAETAGAITLFVTERFGIPVSTTHTLTGSIIGVGLTKRVSAVRWGVTINLIWAWIITIPISALFAAIVFSIIKLFP